MSYEGTDVVLCKNGHVRYYDCYEGVRCDDPRYVCSNCGEQFVHMRGVDQTNDEGVWPEMKVKTEEETKVCDMGFEHVVREETYYPWEGRP